ncbi:hypothetical protein BHE90_005284 [Fusarium euwallaceae]|uniref:Heterokaryon incompatibility domain-containing protein n=4 Tax=Fusarium solani species complex TaxID=232080 RepID=A0A3M2RT76_9HYPO|nr:hypothetical protein CDV36_011942 [Fusarium kuroshium]RSL43489.1 hypothetical protein CEP51_016357 [Fusarium floridanum]RSL83598.1 hypothetical protein CEP52_016672 [Fusarium oligoseptatum]RTE80195.1 hypothetical protein BHE90_005284 [Fusarium euwallaceae]
MRLINTATLALVEFFGDQVPEYIILSHTWQEEEVTFRDWADQALASRKKGYHKIVDTCELARKQGYGYVWVDTNCIDKSSSAELSEAINSMFSWYKGARVCYVYLSDVPSPALGEPLDTKIFRRSRWFTRGWTLQELLAPRDVEFYSKDWSLLGTKVSLCPEISLTTGIDVKYLGKKCLGVWYICPRSGAVVQSIEYDIPVNNASVAERLSWVSNRSTTRTEDIAYCMLGILGLHMPLLYEVAFLIISSSTALNSEGEPVHWKWHFWRVSPEEAAILQAPYAKADWPEVDRFEKALRNPDIARWIDFKPSQTHLSVSLANHYTPVGAGAICHMHFSWSEYPIPRSSFPEAYV